MAFKNILLIDDDEEDQEIFLSVVEQVSAEVDCTCFNDATDALSNLLDQKITPDVIFLDLNMPVMNGRQFLERIKQNKTLANIPVIIFTTSSDAGTKKAMQHLGAHDFITKPGDFNLLVRILQPLLS